MGTPSFCDFPSSPVLPAGDLTALLDAFRRYMAANNLSDNTISAYLYGVKAFFSRYPVLDQNNVSLYKASLMERYRPQTVNMRIRALNCFLKSQDIHDYKIPSVRLQQKSFIDHVISQADYEYLKNCLFRDGQYMYYFAIRFMAATGMRVSELIEVCVEDVLAGYIDVFSKGNRIRRVYIPHDLREPCLKWLENDGRTEGYIFLNRFGSQITTTGVREQLKQFAIRYGLDTSVVHPHAFRHLFARNFIERCDDIAMLSDILGHESIETTRIYLHRSSTEQQQIFNEVVNW